MSQLQAAPVRGGPPVSWESSAECSVLKISSQVLVSLLPSGALAVPNAASMCGAFLGEST